MKFKFYTGITISIIVGFFVATGVLYTGNYVFKYIQTKGYALYETVNDLGSKTSYAVEVKKVEEKGESSDSDSKIGKYYLYENFKAFPKLTSKAFLIADLDNGQLIKGKNLETIYPIASLTKLMTALVSLETVDQEGETRVSYNAINTYGKQGGLYSGQILKVSDLLYPILLESSNDATEVLAEFSGRNFFMANLNGKARSIGLVDTSFADPSGLSDGNVSTAEDLFKLTQYIYRNNPEIFEITKLKDFEGGENKWFNNSRFRNDERYVGGKNGYIDESLHTLISIFDLPLVENVSVKSSKNQDRRIAIILLKGEETEDDTRAIILWLLKNVYYQ